MAMDSSVTTYYQTSDSIPENNFDYMLRVKQYDDTEGEPYVAYMEQTSKFAEKYVRPFFENSVLTYVLKNLWLTHQYNQEYTSFLLKTCSREEFLSKAAEYARSFEEISSERLGIAANILLDKLEQPLTSAELSLLLNVEPGSLDEATLALPEYNGEDQETDQDA